MIAVAEGMDHLIGRGRVAHALKVSPRTASRMKADGILKVDQLRGRNSPWRVAVAEIKRLLGADQEDRDD